MGTGKRDDHGKRHRVEHLPFHAGEGKDRDVDRRDDEKAEQAWLDHLCTGTCRQGKSFFPSQQTALKVLPLAKATQAVLYDDDCPIDDQAKIQCAQAHQIRRDAILDLSLIHI